MTEILAEKACTPCRGGIPPLARDEALRFQKQAPDWELRDDAHRIERTFRFHNFREALAFVQQVGELAESEGHHPDISFGWGRATVSLSTKKTRDCTRTISSWRARSTAWPIGRVRLQPELHEQTAAKAPLLRYRELSPERFKSFWQD